MKLSAVLQFVKMFEGILFHRVSLPLVNSCSCEKVQIVGGRVADYSTEVQFQEQLIGTRPCCMQPVYNLSCTV